MNEPTTPFALHTFEDIKVANFSINTISRSKLRNRIIYVKTKSGNVAKLLIQSGDNLRIVEMVVYGGDGIIKNAVQNLIISANLSCDVDLCIATTNDADFKWVHAIAVQDMIVATENVSFFICTDFEEITFNEIHLAVFQSGKISGDWLHNQVVYCKTNQGRFAKLLIEANNNLLIRRLVVYNADGGVFLDKFNFIVPPSNTVDLDTGAIATAGFDLWWEAVDDKTRNLVPLKNVEIAYEAYYQFNKYLPLINHKGIQMALIITGNNNRNYQDWTLGEKLQLQEYLYLREINQLNPISGPPAFTVKNGNNIISDNDAMIIYFKHVAQSFWADANNIVPWRLVEITDEERLYLLDMRKLCGFISGQGYVFQSELMGGVTPWCPEISFQFMLENDFIKPSRHETIYQLVDWARRHLKHIATFSSPVLGGPFASWEDQYNFYFNYLGLPPVDKIIFPLPDRPHITGGCYTTTGLLAAVLRSVNIPVKSERSNLSGILHSRTSFFTENIHLAHADDPYNAYVIPGINTVPIEQIFYSDQELNDLILAPTPLPGKTIPETATFNLIKHLLNLAIAFKTDLLLKKRCNDMATGIQFGEGSALWSDLHDYFSDAEIADITVSLTDAIADIPGGCSVIGGV